MAVTSIVYILFGAFFKVNVIDPSSPVVPLPIHSSPSSFVNFTSTVALPSRFTVESKCFIPSFPPSPDHSKEITDTVPTGGGRATAVTVKLVLPTIESDVARIVVVPSKTPVATLLLIVATV